MQAHLRTFPAILTAIFFLHVPITLRAQEACEPAVGSFVSHEGEVSVQTAGGVGWTAAKSIEALCQGDTIRVGRLSRAAVSLITGAVLRIDANSTIRLVNILPDEDERSLLDMVRGAIQSFSRKPRRLAVNTPYLNGSIEGTEFVVRVEEDAAAITVLEGIVVASNGQGEVRVEPGQVATAAAGVPPRASTLVTPRSAVQWALYYPPLYAAGEPSTPALREAASCAARDDTRCTIQALDAVPISARGSEYHLLRASTLLSVGQVAAAENSIAAALAANADLGEAYALRAMVDLANNRDDEALANARHAVALSPGSAAATIALSYALQAHFELIEARAVLRQAASAHADNAQVWARLAELELMLDERQASMTAAETAVGLDPNSARARQVLGFATLADFHHAAALATFNEAVRLDSADPLGHLGQGLALISTGEVRAGRQALEAAVALDSNRALLRAYLGKAYFEERRPPLDSEQYAIARQLDPADPTAYLYSGIALQTRNQPVPALQQLEASIDRNDNRAVYRSRLLLDRDRAARGTSLARVYSDLGFARIAVLEASRSLTTDPANAGAHRFLSDSYRQLPRHEIARVSELLQAQLMQDININPVQPSIAETNLNIVALGGPAATGFNEFTPLFQRDQTDINVAALAGSNDTYSAEGVISGVRDRLSYSLGGYHYESDGFRENNDLENDIVDLYLQYAVSSQLNLQLELRRRESEQGDIRMNFDPEAFDPAFRRDFTEDSYRVGARLNIDPRSLLLVSFIKSDSEDDASSGEEFIDDISIPGLPVPVSFSQATVLEQDTDLYEMQYQRSGKRLHVVAGLSLAESERDETTDFSLSVGPPIGIEDSGTFAFMEELENRVLYVYTDTRLLETLSLTAGVSYQRYEEEAVAVTTERLNPKLGLRWQLGDGLELRGAFFKTIKSPLASNRTIEPTQVAGFNQFFDDANGSRTEGYGLGLDWYADHRLHVGAQGRWRDYDQIRSDVGTLQASFEPREERVYNAYAYWTPVDTVSVALEATLDEYEGNRDGFLDQPSAVDTLTIPLTMRYFSKAGWFAGVAITYVDQDVERPTGSISADGGSAFTPVDLSLGYRFPRRRGICSVTMKNLLDESFDYQDDSFRTFGDQPNLSPYIPEVSVMGNVTFNF